MGEILKYQGNPSIYLEEPYIIDSIYRGTRLDIVHGVVFSTLRAPNPSVLCSEAILAEFEDVNDHLAPDVGLLPLDDARNWRRSAKDTRLTCSLDFKASC